MNRSSVQRFVRLILLVFEKSVVARRLVRIGFAINIYLYVFRFSVFSNKVHFFRDIISSAIQN